MQLPLQFFFLLRLTHALHAQTPFFLFQEVVFLQERIQKRKWIYVLKARIIRELFWHPHRNAAPNSYQELHSDISFSSLCFAKRYLLDRMLPHSSRALHTLQTHFHYGRKQQQGVHLAASLSTFRAWKSIAASDVTTITADIDITVATV